MIAGLAAAAIAALRVAVASTTARRMAAKPVKADIVLAKRLMPFSDQRSPLDTDELSAAPKRRSARSKAGSASDEAPDAKDLKDAKAAKDARPAAKKTTLAKTADKLAKLGLTRDIDLVLH